MGRFHDVGKDIGLGSFIMERSVLLVPDYASILVVAGEIFYCNSA